MASRVFAVAVLLLVGSACDRGGARLARSPASPARPEDRSGTVSSLSRGMVRVPDGAVRVGGDTRPVPVKSFWIDRTEVTVRDYEACVSAGRCTAPHDRWGTCNWPRRAERSDHPINCVDWRQASSYCAWAGKRLPTEPEWEFAARGSDARAYPWGDTFAEGAACVKRRPGEDGTCPVDRFATDASPFGVLGMAGNVKEWTFGTEMLPGNVEARVIRGSGWSFDAMSVTPPGRVVERESLRSSEFASDLGFRCAADTPPPTPPGN